MEWTFEELLDLRVFWKSWFPKKKKKENQSERRIFCPSLLAPSRGGRHAMTGGLPRRAFGQLVEGVLGPLAWVHEPFFLFSTR